MLYWWMDKPLLYETVMTVPEQLTEIKNMLEQINQQAPNHVWNKSAALSELADKIVGVAQTQAVIVEQLKAISETNKKIVETVYGNGKPGLTTVVAETKKDMDAVMNVFKTLLFTLMGLGVTALFYLVLSHGFIK